MSAYMVSEDTILTLAFFATLVDGYAHSVDLAVALPHAQDLYDANVRSLQHRYREDPHESGMVDFPRPVALDLADLLRLQRWFQDPVALLKIAHCFEYQACEFPDWPESAAHRCIETVTMGAIARLAGYDQAPWGLP